jgi:hypothetical protein
MHKSFCVALVLFSAWPIFASEVGVRIRFGLTDKQPKKWDATISVLPGKIERIDGWRFQDTDEIQGQTGWKASTRPLTVRRSNNPKKAGKGKGGNANMADNGVILLLTGVNEGSRVKVKSEQGDFDFQLSDVGYGKFIEKLDGAVDIERVAASRPLTTARIEDDYPALAVAPDGTTFAAWIGFTPGLDRDQRAQRLEKEPELAQLAKEPGGDQLWLRVQKDGAWSEPLAVTQGHGDLYKCSVTVDGKGNAWVFWSENASWPKQSLANFEIKARSWSKGKLSEPVSLSENPGNDVNPVAAMDGNGRVWVAWQGARGNVFRILERHQKTDGTWSAERSVSTQKGNCWTPAIAATTKGELVAIAWDTYDKGDYDVWMREFSGETPSEARPVANSEKYEARPALTYDRDWRLWISYELSGPTWGKDWGALVRNKGIGLYRDRQIGMRVLENGKWFEPAGSFVSALPGAQKRRGPANLPVNRPEPEVTTRRVGQEAEAGPVNVYNNLGRIVCDEDGRIWLFARSREGAFHTPLGSVWIDYAAYYDGKAWVGPIILPHSDNLLYNLPAIAAHPQGGVVIAHSTDHRQDRHVQRGRGGNDSLSAMRDPFDNDVFLSRLEMTPQPVTNSLKPASQPPLADAQPSAATIKERSDVERCRAWKIDYQGKPLQLIRGEFHRHTEISGDGGNDGPVEDMWRYAIDVAAMDWLGCGDHDNGAGREYTWWLTQKTTDAFRLPSSFDPPFSYERSVSYPEGHRNVVFAQRGVRTLPRLAKTEAEPVVHAPDTQMLYKYLREFNGVCASHSSATDMGTDWRDNDPEYEPMVEIYQGCRQSYERPGAPRSPSAQDAIGGWRPKGFVNLALLKGYKFAFESSSDHTSTHISYAMVYSEGRSREELLKAMRARHTYAATDNIVADWRSGEHMQGDEFTTSQTPAFQLKLMGTAPFSKVTIVKDDVEIKTVTPDKAEVELTWTDPSPTPGKISYYYARGEQSDGELVWASPMWVTYSAK